VPRGTRPPETAGATGRPAMGPTQTLHRDLPDPAPTGTPLARFPFRPEGSGRTLPPRAVAIQVGTSCIGAAATEPGRDPEAMRGRHDALSRAVGVVPSAMSPLSPAITVGSRRRAATVEDLTHSHLAGGRSWRRGSVVEGGQGRPSIPGVPGGRAARRRIPAPAPVPRETLDGPPRRIRSSSRSREQEACEETGEETGDPLKPPPRTRAHPLALSLGRSGVRIGTPPRRAPAVGEAGMSTGRHGWEVADSRET
jgi:hypothetical protein